MLAEGVGGDDWGFLQLAVRLLDGPRRGYEGGGGNLGGA